jgi:hypothetical protein
VSSVAEKMLKKMGWSKGEGLGKDKQGISTHITVTKRKDDEGIGAEKIQAAEFGNTWWNGALEKTMYKMKVGNIPVDGGLVWLSDGMKEASSHS